MSRAHKTREQVFAVLRLDPFQESLESKVTVTKVLTQAADAEAEVQRLNDLNADKGCRYIFQTTRLFRGEVPYDE